jgi:ELWxxDGT repeat protein
MPTGGTTLQVLGVSPTPSATLSEDVLVFAQRDLVFAFGSTRAWSWDGQGAPVLLGTFATTYEPVPYGGFVALGLDGRSVLFFPDDGVHGFEPWWSDGTPAGTRLLADLTPGSGSTTVWAGFSVEDRIVFWAITPSTGSEPWTTDGTPVGTTLLADLEPGAGGSTADTFAGVGGVGWRRVVLPISTSAYGSELWVSDGTPAGTRLLADANPGPASSIPPFGYWAWNAGSSLIVAMDDGVHGVEPHAVDFDATTSWLLGNCSRRGRYLVHDPVLGTPWRLEAIDVTVGGVALLALPAAAPILFDSVCAVQLDVATSALLTAILPDASGRWTDTVPLPGSASLVGASIVTQAAFLDPTRPAGFAVADAWFATLGF